MKNTELIKLLELNDWKIERIKRSHIQFIHAESLKILTMPNNECNLKPATVDYIMAYANVNWSINPGSERHLQYRAGNMIYFGFAEYDKDYTLSGGVLHVPGCIFSSSDPKEAETCAASAIETHIELLIEKGMHVPTPPENFCLCKVKNEDIRGLEFEDNVAWYNIRVSMKRLMSQ